MSYLMRFVRFVLGANQWSNTGNPTSSQFQNHLISLVRICLLAHPRKSTSRGFDQYLFVLWLRFRMGTDTYWYLFALAICTCAWRKICCISIFVHRMCNWVSMLSVCIVLYYFVTVQLPWLPHVAPAPVQSQYVFFVAIRCLLFDQRCHVLACFSHKDHSQR